MAHSHPLRHWLRPLALAALAFSSFALPALQAHAQSTRPAASAVVQDTATALVGWWEEYSPSSNIVQFLPDGTVRLYLKKGEIDALRSLDGTWKVASDPTGIEMVFTVRGRTLTRRAQISFEGPEMVIHEGKTQPTRHRRHSGQLPEAYLW
ncbi:hypothetical protein PMI14_05977 [Acidovorax sp. CF316]|uniref:hypothetical protein n=1 Tax=Acidovorax sp. CF316 TaxID=1144317 RepID=UPI00026BD845|nr:hypothetical protein [Acidovorax sp. CF316]EJE49458.1 hypothetical protein PMI14_05977 [Acidovorax sp. CF316]